MDTGDKPQHGIQGQNRTAAIADKGQGQADDRGDADAHTHVTDYLKDQRRRRAEADHAPHVIRGADTHIDAPGDDRNQHGDGENTAHKAQLLPDGREDIVGMLGIQAVGLGADAVEQPLSGEAAAGEGAQGLHGVIPLVDAGGVNGGIKQNAETVALKFTEHIVPEYRRRQHDRAAADQEPQELDTAGKDHADVDKHKDQGNARILGQHIVHADDDNEIEKTVKNGYDMGGAILPCGHNRCQHQNKEYFADFGGLNIERNQRQIQPTAVAGAVVGAKGDEQRQQKHGNPRQQAAVLGENLRVDGGDHGVQKHTQRGCDQLDNEIPGEAHGVRRTAYDQTAKGGGHQTH